MKTTPCNVDDDRKRSRPEHAGKAFGHLSYGRLDPRQDTNNTRYKDGQRLRGVAMLRCE
jgi:hypothetical protein